MVTLPQPGQTDVLGTTSLVRDWSCDTCCWRQEMVAVCVAFNVDCCRLMAYWLSFSALICAWSFSYTSMSFWSVYLSARSRPISESLAASCCPRSNSCLVTNCCWLQPHLLLPNSPLRPPLFSSPRAVPAMPSQSPLPATPFGHHQSRTSDSPPKVSLSHHHDTTILPLFHFASCS